MLTNDCNAYTRRQIINYDRVHVRSSLNFQVVFDKLTRICDLIIQNENSLISWCYTEDRVLNDRFQTILSLWQQAISALISHSGQRRKFTALSLVNNDVT